MDIAGWYPDVILLSANFYDALYQEAGAELAGNLFIQSQFHPLELADDEKATQDYLDLMEQHNPAGKIALLGQQGLPTWLLFARDATRSGTDPTAQGVIDEARAMTVWEAGGLHAPQPPRTTTQPACHIRAALEPHDLAANRAATK